MKKILAVILCLGFITTPCFAHGGFDGGHGSGGFNDRRLAPQPVMERRYDRFAPHGHMHDGRMLRHDRRIGETAAAVTVGVLGAAALAAVLAN